jgi:hypothetical protein
MAPHIRSVNIERDGRLTEGVLQTVLDEIVSKSVLPDLVLLLVVP